MSQALEQVYASGGDVLINTLELSCAAWAEPILLCDGYENKACITEDDRAVTFRASGIAVALPDRGTSGGQTLTFAIDNVTGEAQQNIDAALEAEERMILTYRCYLASDKSAPAEAPYRMTVLDGEINGPSVQVEAGYYDLINSAWPRDLYTTEFAPGLKYL
ncbi:DUF1833 family protein [Stutzerimonas stutzeri]|uniref:DUF1833 family protein n=1 Tax=Stutzerimonas stutzeri TaxID=316 RepID=UPI0015E29132|nr:DUF1833 family protein [Stutzerimonas stutzeri]MBA1278129.1 DUF1833 family protein [Stutzerimonas stutzeri]